MFTEQITALFWALPAVLLIGAGAILLLKRFMPEGMGSRQTQITMRRIGEPFVLSEHTTLHCIEAQGKTFILTESDRYVGMEPLQAAAIRHTRTAWNPWTVR